MHGRAGGGVWCPACAACLLSPASCLLLQAVDSNKEREELFEDWLDEKEKRVGAWLSLLRAGPPRRCRVRHSLAGSFPDGAL